MSSKRAVWLVPATVFLAAACGCAPAYHAYPCGRVPYGYCPEPPLPHAMYCACPTPIAAEFRRDHPGVSADGHPSPVPEGPASARP